MTELLSLSELGVALERYELAAVLAPAEFEDYFETKVQLETRLVEIANQRAADLDHHGTRELLDQVVLLNQEMRGVADRQAEREEGLDDAYRARLEEVSAMASGRILLVQGQIHLNIADEHVLADNLVGARRALEPAAACYAELSAGDYPQSVIGDIARAAVGTRTGFLDGMAAMQRGRYETAREYFEEAFSKYGLMVEELAQEAEGLDERTRSAIGEFQREFQEQATYTSILIKYVEFFCQMRANNYENAVVYATDAVGLYVAWLNRAVAANSSALVQRLRRMELEYFRGWEAWARAEHAVENREWDECHRLLLAAKQHWFTSGDMARRYALLGVMTPQYQVANAEMLLQSTLRRRASEKRLDEQIDTLRAENRQLRAMNIVNYGGDNVAKKESNKISIKGDVTGPVAAGHAKVTTGDVHSGDTVTNTTVDNSVTNLTDLRQLADELAELRELMSAGAVTSAQHESVHQIELAEQRARIGDEKGVLAHLKAAGRWALLFAERLTMSAAETMIKASLGP